MLGLLLAASALMQADAWNLVDVKVKGAERYAPGLIASASGLRAGAKVGKGQFDSACQKLVQSGLFQFCNYKYRPVSATGVALELEVREAPADHTAKIAIPGVEEAEIWGCLSQREPLVARKLPGSDEANRFYIGAIQSCLRDRGSSIELAATAEADEAGQITIVFRPAHLASIVDVRFKGNVLFTEKRLRDVLTTVASRAAFIDDDFLRLLDLHIRPMYEELGRLGLTFTDIKTEPCEGGVTVTTTLTEGPVYVLKAADIEGEGVDKQELSLAARLPIGRIANWRHVVEGLEAAAELLRNDGYLDARYQVERKLDENSGTVAARIIFNRGDRFTFGSLEIRGLPEGIEDKVRGLWRIRPGDPLNANYVNEYLRQAFQIAGREYRTVSKGVTVRPGTRIVDVTATFAP